MLSTCLNQCCQAAFRYLYEGRIFTVERFVTSPDGLKTDRVIEHFWLCGRCSRSMKVVVDHGAVTAVPMDVELMAEAPAKANPLLAG